MSVLKQSLATSSRFRGIYRYLLQAKGQREKEDILGKRLSPDKLVENKPSPRPMFENSLREAIKCRLLIREEEYITIHPELPPAARDKKTGDRLLPNTLTTLFFASENQDEYDFGLVCAWFLCQDIYDPPGTWEKIEQKVAEQNMGEVLKMTSSGFFGKLDDWTGYLGLSWGHALERKRAIVPDPTLYVKRNLDTLFQELNEKILLTEFIDRLAIKCPLFETGKFREEIEDIIGHRQPNHLSTSTSFALFRLQEEGYIQLERESDADLMLLPKNSDRVDNEGRISHITYLGGKEI